MKSRPLQTMFTLLCITAACWLLQACGSYQNTYYIVRHADRNWDVPDGLTDAGRERAVILRDSLLGKGIDRVYVTPFHRTYETAAPLLLALGQDSITYAADEDSIQVFASRLLSMRNKDVLVVGHSNTILPMAEALGIKPETEYINEPNGFDLMLIVTVIRKRKIPFAVSLQEVRYGPEAH